MKHLLLLLLLVRGELMSLLGAVQPVYAPTSVAGVEGNSFLSPLGGQGGFIATRFQQIYSSSLFSAFPEGVGINTFSVRPEGPFGNPFATRITIEIYLSTTSKPVDGLSTTLDENVGADARLVRGAVPFLLTGSGGIPGPTSWLLLADVRDDPFYYNPAAGNLLVDMKIYNFPATSPLDAVLDSGDTVSSAYELLGTGIQLDTRGLATEFVVTPVPEPGTLSFIILGLVWAGVVGRKGILRKLKAYGAG